MKVTSEFSKEQLVLNIQVQCNLLRKYYKNFVGLLKEDSTVPEGYSVTQLGPDTAMVSVPITTHTDEAVGFNVAPIMGVIDRFANSALRYELEHTEFIPLTGYPEENLKTDIKTSVSKKRNLCIIKDYAEYLRMESEHKYIFNQLYVKFGTDEWAEIVLSILGGELDILRSKLQQRLVVTEWT